MDWLPTNAGEQATLTISPFKQGTIEFYAIARRQSRQQDVGMSGQIVRILMKAGVFAPGSSAVDWPL